MRRAVVLPAPLGPSRPVMRPSSARRSTPSTALMVPVLVLNALWSWWAWIMGSGLPSVERGEGRQRADVVQAACIERGGVGRFDELRHQLGHAAGRQGAVALALQHQVAAIGQAFEHPLGE